MDIPMLVIGFLIVLGPLVLVHELGHFLMAKRAGIRVLEFGFGFPPRLFKFWQGKGHLSIGNTRIIIPANFKGLPPSAVELRLAGEQETQTEASGHSPSATGHLKPLDVGDYVEVTAEKQANGNYILRRLTALDAAQDDVSPVNQKTVEGFYGRGMLTEYVPGTIYSVNWLLPIGGFTRMLGEEDPSAPDSFAAAPKRWRTAVLLAGPLSNILLALIILTVAWMSGVQEPVTCRVEVMDVGANTPAEAAGLQPQDIILKADDEPIDVCFELTGYISQRGGQQVVLEIERNGQVILVPITPRAQGQYDPSREGPLGIHIMNHAETWVIRQASLPEALMNALATIAFMVTGILSLPFLVLKGAALSLLGPIGISQAGGEAIVMSRQVGTLFPILALIGQVSIALGLTNLLPLPALDGGRLLFIVFEWIRGRRVDPRKEMVVHWVGLGLLLILGVLVSYHDVVRLLSGQRLF